MLAMKLDVGETDSVEPAPGVGLDKLPVLIEPEVAVAKELDGLAMKLKVGVTDSAKPALGLKELDKLPLIVEEGDSEPEEVAVPNALPIPTTEGVINSVRLEQGDGEVVSFAVLLRGLHVPVVESHAAKLSP